ncbi:hypothetical protein BX285_0988 [Streptomyces sp. 1114.5]|uniref:hypothetical protein n=1 Tax=Streptomyces sp. 1114.5 TaxID=1938830 RepID=UPI000EAF3155|nr:hypothetical protein [Streptomyces sp. 1114.5]RKT16642.1 hypothetical protein BX285_0988 [Streptomyces sp. 1114.5]
METAAAATAPCDDDIRIGGIHSDDIHIGVEHECKWQLPPAAAADPAAFARTAVFAELVAAAAEPQDYLQSVLYLDDASGSLARAGHSLSIVVNSGAPSDTCVVVCKQTIHRRGWRDGLELRQRVPHRQVGARLHDGSLLPVAHVRRLGLVTGALQPAGVAVQRRYKWYGRTTDGTEVCCSLDHVEFGAPTTPRAERRRYDCVEIEVNSSLPAVLAGLDRLARELDVRLGVPRDRSSKSQLAREADRDGREADRADRDGRADG